MAGDDLKWRFVFASKKKNKAQTTELPGISIECGCNVSFHHAWARLVGWFS